MLVIRRRKVELPNVYLFKHIYIYIGDSSSIKDFDWIKPLIHAYGEHMSKYWYRNIDSTVERKNISNEYLSVTLIRNCNLFQRIFVSDLFLLHEKSLSLFISIFHSSRNSIVFHSFAPRNNDHSSRFDENNWYLEEKDTGNVKL